MPYALIENGEVVQLWLPENPPPGYIECGPEVQPGYTYDGENFYPPVIPPPPPPPPYALPVALLWMRMTDTEAEDFDAEMSVASPLRLRRAFNTAQQLTEDSELFNFVKDVLTSTFTEIKADELLQAQQPGEEYMASAGDPLS